MPDMTFADRAEKFYSELVREYYVVGAGLKPELELAPIYVRYADLFEEPTVRERIAAMQHYGPSAAPPAGAAEAQSTAARALAEKEARHLADFAISSYIENAVKELSESVTNAELKATVRWDDREIPYQDVRSVLVRESDWIRRHDLQQRQLAVLVQQNPQRLERIKTQHDLARRLGFPGYRGMIERLRGWDLSILAKALRPLVEETDSNYEDKLGQYLSEVHVPRSQANLADVMYLLRAPYFDPFFPADRLIPVLDKTISAMGLPLDSTPGLHLDTEPRPLKSPRAFCVPVRVPAEVYLVIKPIGGQEDYGALLHESGHAEHLTHVEPGLPFAFRYLGEEAISETYAFLFEGIMDNPRWLVDMLRVPMREAERYRRFALFNKLWFLRRYTAKLHYELILHDQGPAGAESAYRDILGEALHLPVPPERYLDDVDDAFYVAGYLRAWIFERQLARFFVEQFGEGWYESRDAGDFLRSLWSIGMRDPVDELARKHIGAKGLDPSQLIEELSDF